ncbi:JmjC domain [Trinorchestia longiramus]|nr:JmjC domain [Trinorchestia longiramus]
MQDFDTFYCTEEVPHLSCEDFKAWELLAQEKPVILTNTGLCNPALKWDLNYLEKHIGTSEHVVFASNSNIFKYYDEHKIKFCPDFKRPTEKMEMTFKDFLTRFRDWKPGDKRLYLQQSLSSNIGPKVAADFVSFNWLWLRKLMKIVHWGPLTSNLLLIAMQGNVTPVHYDEQQNLFCQLVGHKKVILFSPDHHNRLYPHPVYHPHDRQSQVDLSRPDFERFPGLRHIKGHEAVVGPGDVLYIPIYWWHEVHSLPPDPYTVSLNFWYKAPPTENVSYPLLPRQEVVIMRNIEKMVVDVFKDASQVDHFFQSLTLGRYTVVGAGVPAQLSTSIHNCTAHTTQRQGVADHVSEPSTSCVGQSNEETKLGRERRSNLTQEDVIVEDVCSAGDGVPTRAAHVSRRSEAETNSSCSCCSSYTSSPSHCGSCCSVAQSP